jgi:hypothetical protein
MKEDCWLEMIWYLGDHGALSSKLQSSGRDDSHCSSLIIM